MTIQYTDSFIKQLRKKSHLSERISKQIELFRNNPLHPSLHTEKLEPRYKNMYSFRINKQWRILFEKHQNAFILHTISKHYE